ncbi:hypothetical protein DSECCO2_468320 [anaerobic digester metagenome]
MKVFFSHVWIHYIHDEPDYIHAYVVDQLKDAHRAHQEILADPVDCINGFVQGHFLCQCRCLINTVKRIAHKMAVADKTGNIVGGNDNFSHVFRELQGKLFHFAAVGVYGDQLNQFLHGRGIVEVKSKNSSPEFSFLVQASDGYRGGIGKKPWLIGVIFVDLPEEPGFKSRVFADGFKDQGTVVSGFKAGTWPDDPHHIINIGFDDFTVFDQFLSSGIKLPQLHRFFLGGLQHLRPDVLHQSRQRGGGHVHGIYHEVLIPVSGFQHLIGHFKGRQQQNAAAHFAGSAEHGNI